MIRHTPPSRERGTVRRLAALAIATFAVAFGLTGCRRSVPHMQRLLTYLDEELAALEVATGIA